MTWREVLAVLSQACAEQGTERKVTLVLPDGCFHLKEPLETEPGGDPDLLGFVVFQDDPQLSKRTEETCLLFVRPEQILRVQVSGVDPAGGGPLGF